MARGRAEQSGTNSSLMGNLSRFGGGAVPRVGLSLCGQAAIAARIPLSILDVAPQRI
jgi:hypothetical protein